MSLRIFFVLLFLFAAFSSEAARKNKGYAKHTVIIENMVFNPKEIAVHVGDTIVWINKDLVPHTATGISNTMESGSISAGSKWSAKIKKEMVGDYHCSFHPTMTGTITDAK